MHGRSGCGRAARIALAGAGSAAGRRALLQDAALRRSAGRLTPPDLRTHLRHHGVSPDWGMTVQHGSGGRRLVLADELAGAGAEALPARAEPDQFTSVSGVGSTALAGAAEAWRRDALLLATGATADERLRALNALLGAGLPTEAIRGLLLFALRDDARRVRRGALTALRGHGVPAPILEACLAIASDRRSDLARGATLLGALEVPATGGLELAVPLLTVATALRDPDAAPIREELIRWCGRLGAATAASPGLLSDLLDVLLREAAAGPTEAAAALRDALRGLAATAPRGLAPRLLAEAAQLPPGPGRTAVLLTLSEMALTPAGAKALHALLLDTELTRYLDVGESLVPFRAYMRRHGARLLAAVSERAAVETGDRRALLLALVGVALADAEPSPTTAARRKAAKQLVPLLDDREPSTAVGLLRTGLAGDRAVAAKARRRIISAGLELLTHGASEDFADEVLAAAAALGPDAVPLLVEFAGDDLLDKPLRRAALAQAARAASAHPAAAAVATGLRAARRYAKQAGFKLADAMLALAGSLAAHPAAGEALQRRTVQDCLKAMRAAPDPRAVGGAEGLAAFADTAGMTMLDTELRAQCVRALLRLIEQSHHSTVAVGSSEPGEAQLEEGAGAALQTRALPAALVSLRHLAATGEAVPIGHALLNWWNRLSAGELVLAPGARHAVADAMAEVALELAPTSPELRARVTAALISEFRRLRELPLAPVLARLLSAEPPLKEAAEAAAATMLQLLELADSRDLADEERSAALAGAARIAAGGVVAAEAARSAAKVIARVGRRTRRPSAALRAALRTLADSPSVAAADRSALLALAGGSPA
ncbi:MAG: hypothetical protein ACYTGX_11720 [Planctomycetota bacterium]